MPLPTVLEVVAPGPAAVAGLAVGDELVSINGVVPADVIEYQQLVDEGDLELVMRRGGLERTMWVDKAPGAPLGIRLDSSIFDRVQTCDNHCAFCFIYQLPPGMRKSLYLKDDDFRLSFLYGNFTTLTRFTELDLARVVEEGLGPLYVSIHATDPVVRSAMLRNRRGGTSLRWLRALLERGITVHGQIVLCPGHNDGAVLERTCAEIVARYPGLASVGIVPIGLSRFNAEASLRVHTPGEAADALDTIARWQEVAGDRLQKKLFFAADELYLMAGRRFPASGHYEGFPQHENGIGMARAFYDELELLESGADPTLPTRTGEWRTLPAAPAAGYRSPRARGGRSGDAAGMVALTGRYGAAVLGPVRRRLAALAGRSLRVLEVDNEFFGGNVAVSGLLTGGDLRKAILADGARATYLVPDVALSGERFLDDVTIGELAAAVDVPVLVVPASATGLVMAGRR